MWARLASGLVPAALLAACGGGGGSSGSNGSPPPTPPPYSSVTLAQLSKASTFFAGCDGVAPNGTLYVDTAAEPSFVVNPVNAMNLIAGWQQNRWSTGGAQGLSLAASFDGGTTWTPSSAAFSRCMGAAAGTAGDYARATDVWLTASPTSGAVYALSLSFTGGTLVPGSSSAMLVAQSLDGGRSWGAPVALIQDGDQFFDDKGSITADPTDPNYVYAVWDRLSGASAGPAYFAVTANAGTTWAAAGSIYDPGSANQTLGNQIVVLPGDVVLDVFTELDTLGGQTTAQARLVRSLDHGTTWSTPTTIAELAPLGTVDPRTGQAVRDGADIVTVSVAPGGAVYVAWQDARFSAGARDGIAMTHSTDGGTTWSTPIQVNADPSAQAFTPTVHVGANGVIAVTYYDLRNDAFAPFGSLLADAWLVTTSDGSTFQETHLSGPFDMDLAPDSRGLFVGDYEALSSTTGFLPLYVQTDAGSAVRSDAFMAFPTVTASAHAAVAHAMGPFQAPTAPGGLALPRSARQQIAERIETRRLERRREPE